MPCENLTVAGRKKWVVAGFWWERVWEGGRLAGWLVVGWLERKKTLLSVKMSIDSVNDKQ